MPLPDAAAVMGRLGLARKAGRLVVGREAVQASLRGRRSRMVVLAEDAGASLRQQIVGQAERVGVPVYHFSTCRELGARFGRGKIDVVSLDDARFVQALRPLLDRAATPAPMPAGTVPAESDKLPWRLS